MMIRTRKAPLAIEPIKRVRKAPVHKRISTEEEHQLIEIDALNRLGHKDFKSMFPNMHPGERTKDV